MSGMLWLGVLEESWFCRCRRRVVICSTGGAYDSMFVPDLDEEFLAVASQVPIDYMEEDEQMEMDQIWWGYII